ncbi:hypothetical protein [Burkholderia seminalis]|uniref:hypothetical protein n=1 Tax=Burkholderia seminalis TaxID=488731 RepID=UPI000F5ACC77|nr:hypothetical protein [Burkholderia seminalis]RQS86689.1 hypothetical protein DF048_30875 [Burkholderia seminalis]
MLSAVAMAFVGAGSMAVGVADDMIVLGAGQFGCGAVHALDSWDTTVTVTPPNDAGKLTIRALLTNPGASTKASRCRRRLTEPVKRVTGRVFVKTAWGLDTLNADLAAAPDDVMARYRVAFGHGDGMWRDKSATFNAREGLSVLDVEAYLRLVGPR